MQNSEDPAINAYVFMHVLDPAPPRAGFNKIADVLDQFRSKTGVRWAHHFVGSFVAFGAVDADSLEDLQARIAGEFWDAGVRSEWSLAVKPSLYGAPHRASPPFHALIRVRTKRRNPDDVLDDLDAAFAPIVDPLIQEHGEVGWREHFYYAAATVSGKGFDILVELAAASMEDLTTLIFERIRPVEGVSSTDSSFAFIPE
jgi:DNA-binding Lrp family transcriptional regulator